MDFALIGAGLMGRNHARVVSESDDVRLKMVIDSDRSRAQLLAESYGSEWGTGISEIRGVDAVIVASATDSHFSIAKELISSGLPILVEKPIAGSLAEVRDLLELASSKDTPITCGFVERFNPVFSTARSLISTDLVQINSTRQSPRNPRATSSVIWDLLIHDIDLSLQLTGHSSLPTEIHCAGILRPASNSIEAVEAVVKSGQGPLVSHSASRLWHRKVRTMEILDQESLLELDLLRQTITQFRHVSQDQIVNGTLVYRSDTVVDIPFVRHAGEPLVLQFRHFMDLVKGKLDFRDELQGLLLAHNIAESVEKACALNSVQYE